MPEPGTQTSSGFTKGQQRITDNLDQLLEVLPPDIRESLEAQPGLEDLLEVVLDLGREPEARFPGRVAFLLERPVSHEDLEYVTSRVGEFGKDNRAGIERTLHRISAIRNRSGRVVGLTCRIGRAVYGTIDIIRDVVESGKSILMLGRPGVGKTTKLREMARVLSEEFGKRVVIVDTSNEIAGDGDIPHPAIGHARRMQVAQPDQQHAVMIEAVENHMPEVIVIDEIGTEAEAYAARTIAERGVQLIGTAHGNSLENLMMNPTLCDLIGGIQAVTLSDEEAKRRGTQKTVLERKAPPTFDVVIEIMEMDKLAIHHDVGETVDQILRGNQPRPEIRVRTPDGQVQVIQEPSTRPSSVRDRLVAQASSAVRSEGRDSEFLKSSRAYQQDSQQQQPKNMVRIFPYGVARSRLERAINDLRAPAVIARDMDSADAVVALKAHYRREPGKLKDASGRNLPTFVIRSNTYAQIAGVIREMFQIPDMDEEALAIRDAEEGVERVLENGEPVELLPQNA
ncbi:MAG: AAA family ATPase, partial [Armatimonadota bacterium]